MKEYRPILEIEFQRAYHEVLSEILSEKRLITTAKQFEQRIKLLMFKKYGEKSSNKEELKRSGFPFRWKNDPRIPISYDYFREVRAFYLDFLKKTGRFSNQE